MKIYSISKWKFRWKRRNKHEKKLMKYPTYRINKQISKDKEIKKIIIIVIIKTKKEKIQKIKK